jgi:serine/threonine protein kinase
MIANKYKLVKKISEGCFGKVFQGINIRTNEMVAIKIESSNNNMKTLKFEAKIYQYLGELEGFSRLKWFGTDKHKCINYLVMDLLDASIIDIVKKSKMSLNVFLNMGIQMIKRINMLHDKLLLHRDIKPENFLLGKDKQTNKYIVYLIDFGFCKRYETDGEHINETSITNIIGTLNYVSLNVHKRTEPSRRDDLESFIYVLLFIYFGRLEWSNILQEDIIIKKKEEVLDDKNTHIPPFIKDMLKYIRNLKFDEKPNYEYLISLLRTSK